MEKQVIGIIGGSGVDDPGIIKNAQKIEVKTPYGASSGLVTVGTIDERDVAILARHGEGHRINPSNVNYRANIYAFKSLGVTHILAPSAVGSTRLDYKPGDFVVTDQFFDYTSRSRPATFYDGKENPDDIKNILGDRKRVCHINVSEPFCNNLRKIVINELNELGFSYHKQGNCLVFEGPRFSTTWESTVYRDVVKADTLSMTLVPECVLAREAGICYAQIAMVSDYDNLNRNAAVTCEEVGKTMSENAEKVKELLLKVIPKIPEERNCNCKDAYKKAFFDK